MALLEDKTPQPRSPAPQHDPVFIWPTPNNADYLFWVEKNGDLPKNQKPVYGTPYPDRDRYPDHKLVFVSPQTSEKWSKWFYASDRIGQDEYNWNFTQADLGGVRFDQVERLYLYRREDFKHTDANLALKQGDIMPSVPSAFPNNEFLLSERVQVEAPAEELRSLFIFEKRTYFLRAPIAQVEQEELLGVGQGRVTTLYYRGEIPPSQTLTIEALMNDPSDAYWSVQADGTLRAGQQLTHRWFAVVTYSSLDDALEAYKRSFPSSVDLDIPDELLGVTAVWNSAGSNGSFASEAGGRSAYVGDPDVALSLSEQANAECGGSLQPEIIPDLLIRNGRDTPSTAWFFCIKPTAGGLSSGALLAKLSALVGSPVLPWPIFQPKQHTFVLKGQRGSSRAQVSASGAVSTRFSPGQERNNKEVSSAKGTSGDASTSFGTVTLRPSIHKALTVGNSSPQSASYTASCSVGWSSSFTPANVAGYSIAMPIPSNTSPGVLDPSNGVVGTVSQLATVNLAGSVTPTSLGATTPDSVPTSGKYLVGTPRISPYKATWLMVNVQVIDASVFAP